MNYLFTPERMKQVLGEKGSNVSTCFPEENVAGNNGMDR